MVLSSELLIGFLKTQHWCFENHRVVNINDGYEDDFIICFASPAIEELFNVFCRTFCPFGERPTLASLSTEAQALLVAYEGR